jgi:hypothetical protein
VSVLAEEWRPLPGYAGWTDVSNLGRVRRWYEARAGRAPVRMLSEPVIVTTVFAGTYLVFSTRNAEGSPRSKCTLQSAVLTAFSGPRPAGAVACHFPDPTPANCCFDNLRWDSLGQNHMDAKIHHSGMASRVLARLALLRKSFPHLRSDVEGLVFEARPNVYANNGLHMKLRAQARREALARGAA